MHNQSNLKNSDIINFIYIFLISPTLLYYGYLLYKNYNIDPNIGIAIILMSLIICSSNTYLFYQHTISENKLIKYS